MINLSTTQQEILTLFLETEQMQSSIVFEKMAAKDKEISLVSVKRHLSKMARIGILKLMGAGRSTAYRITIRGRVFADINPLEYLGDDPDERYGFSGYNFELLKEFPKELFSASELQRLKKETKEYLINVKNTPSLVMGKELQRLVIELSWKSSKIEGNTYSLLDTEELILRNKKARGHTKDEVMMILNHKDAFNFIRTNQKEFKTITLGKIEKIHSLLVKGMGIPYGLRKSIVGVAGSKYVPLDNIHQIRDAIMDLVDCINSAKDPYTKAALAIAGISYVQPFKDGNKRTGRILANAILLAYHCAPLSYRSVKEDEFKNAILVFDELNSIVPVKRIFMEQYLFATKNYAVK